MDNLCHTLVGAALAESGLRKRTPLATAALVIAANIPDVDGILYVLHHPVAALGFRRGWTHGVLAWFVWPFVVTALLLAWDRWVRRRRHPEKPPAGPRALLLLSLVALLTHPFLDWCNTYGIRLLMPFSPRWFYGDALFIVDPWLWLVLGLGWLAAFELRRHGARRPEWPARAALALSGLYITLMIASNLAARGIVRRAALAEGGPAPSRLMAGPVPLDPFRRGVVIERDSAYELGTFDWLARPRYRREAIIPRDRGLDLPAVRAAAAASWRGRTFLGWARFPLFDVERAGAGYVVRLADARYTLNGRARFGAVAIPVPGTVSSPPVSSSPKEAP